MIKIIKKILLIILVFHAAFLNAEDYNISNNSINIDWKINKQELNFSNAVYPVEFSGLPVYSKALNIGRYSS